MSSPADLPVAAPERAAASKRPRVFRARSIRGLLSVMPSRDLRFTGLTVGWVGVGVIRTVPRKEVSNV